MDLYNNILIQHNGMDHIKSKSSVAVACFLPGWAKHYVFHSGPLVSFITLIFSLSFNNRHAVMCCCPGPVLLVMI